MVSETDVAMIACTIANSIDGGNCFCSLKVSQTQKSADSTKVIQES